MELPDDLLRLMFGLFALVPLSYPLRFMETKLRLWYSLLMGFVVQIYVYRSYVYPVYIQHLIAFALIKFKGPKVGKLVTFQSLAFLSCYNFYEIYTNYGGWTMNASAMLMILVCKYSLLAYNIEDGQLDESAMTEEQKKYRIT